MLFETTEGKKLLLKTVKHAKDIGIKFAQEAGIWEVRAIYKSGLLVAREFDNIYHGTVTHKQFIKYSEIYKDDRWELYCWNERLCEGIIKILEANEEPITYDTPMNDIED